MYIELHSRSAFSFLEGASLPEDLVATCASLNLPAMALLDRDGVYGAPRFHMAAKKVGLKAHIGAEVTCNPFSPQRHGDTEKSPIFNCQWPMASARNQQSKINNLKSLLRLSASVVSFAFLSSSPPASATRTSAA